MKRLIAILIAILTLLLGGTRTAIEPKKTPDTEPVAIEQATAEPGIIVPEPVTDLSAEKEMTDTVSKTVPYEPIVIPDESIEPETITDQTDADVYPMPDTDTSASSFQETESEPDIDEQPEVLFEPAVRDEQPEAIPTTPVTDETVPLTPEKKADDTAPNNNARVFINPAQGGPNPFENAPPTEIDDHPVDEFIGEDGDRPGEGIHF